MKKSFYILTLVILIVCIPCKAESFVSVPAEKPTVASTVVFQSIAENSITIEFSGGNGENRIVVVNERLGIGFIPADLTSYTGVNNDYSLATDQGGGNKIVYDGSGNSVTVTNLSAGTPYSVRIYEYNGGVSEEMYLTDEYGSGRVFTKGDEKALNLGDGNISTLNLNNYPTLTVSLWVKPGANSGWSPVFDNDNGGYDRALHALNGYWSIFHDAHFETNVPYTENVWQHIAVVFSSSATLLYVDGDLRWSGSGSSVLSGGSDVTLGGSFYDFNGQIDELRFWSYERSQAEIVSSMFSSITDDQNGLEAYYTFNTGSIVDDSENGRNGTGSSCGDSYAIVRPEAEEATEVDYTSFTANWTAPLVGLTPDGYYLDVDDNADFSSPLVDNHDAGNVISYDVSELNGSTQYYYRVRAYNSQTGSGPYSEAMAALTSGPPPAPVASPATNVGFSEFTANWERIYGVEGYYLDVARDDLFTEYVSGYNNLDVGNVIEFDLTGLISGTQYFYRLRAYKEEEPVSIYSNVIQVETCFYEPTASSAVSFSATDVRSVTVEFSGGDGDNRIVVVRQYDAVSFTPVDGVEYSGISSDYTSAADQEDNNKIVYTGSGNSVTLTNLLPGTIYYIAVYEFNGTGGLNNYLTTTFGSGDICTRAVERTLDLGRGHISDLDLNDYPTLTVSMWIRPEENYEGNVFDNDNGGYDRALRTDYGSWVIFNESWLSTGIQYSVDSWQHVAVVFSTAATKLYINGNLSWTGAGALISGGYDWVDFGEDFSGCIDELRFWSYERSEAEIQSGMFEYLNGDETGLEAYYTFNAHNFDDDSDNDRDGYSLSQFFESYAMVRPGISEASEIKANSFTVNWNEPVIGLIPTEYFLDVDDDIDFSSPVVDNLNVGNLKSYNVTGLSYETQYYYRIRAYNSSANVGTGPDSEIGTASTNSAPEIVSHPTGDEVCEGELLAMELSALRGETYQWKKNGSIIPDSSRTSLVFSSVSLDDAGDYTCIVTNYDGSIESDTATVVVNENPEVTIISSDDDNTLCEGEQLTLSGSGAVSYTWNNGITDAQAFEPPLGSTLYQLIGTDENNCSDTTNVSILVEICTGIDDIGQAAFRIYPNPFSVSATISYDLPFSSQIAIDLYDINSNKVQQLQNNHLSAGSYNYYIDGSDLTAGTYIVKITVNDKHIIRKLILIK